MKRQNAAEKLSDVLELVHARHYSGLLSVEQFVGGQFEEGEIYFERGCPIYARSTRKAGKEAFSRMVNWRQIYFALDKNAPCPDEQDTSPSSNVSAQEPDWAAHLSSPDEPHLSMLSMMHPISGLPFSNIEQLVPRKLVMNQNVLALPLTRPQRSIYLLVDGKRSIADLARCIGKSIQEIRRLLGELQEQGLVLI